MYTFDSRVRYSEIGEDGRISVKALIDYMQDCTNFQSEDLGVGLAWCEEHGLMWVLNSWQIVIEQYPALGERITVGTQAYGYEKMIGYRNFLITDASGNTVVKANSNWVLMDVKRGQPILVTPEVADVYGRAVPLDMEYAPRKIRLPKGQGVPKDRFVVREYHLDTNHHVNNGQYVQMAREFLPREAQVGELRVEYRQQAKLGDEMVPVVYQISDEECIVSLNDTEAKSYAVVQFFIRM